MTDKNKKEGQGVEERGIEGGGRVEKRGEGR